MRGRRQIVAAQHLRDRPERPEGALQSGHQRLEGLAERQRGPGPPAVAQHEIEQQMRERDAGDRHAQVRRVREVDRRLAAGHRDLLEVHLRLRPMQRPPVPKAPLQCPHVSRLKSIGGFCEQRRQHELGFEHALRVALQQRLDLGRPDLRKRIRPRAPVARQLRRRRSRSTVPLPRRPQTHACRRRGRRLGLAIHTSLPQEPNLRVCDHDHSLARSDHLTQSGRSNCRQAADLIVAAQAGGPLDRANVRHAFQRVLKAANLPKQRFHDLRHGCASYLLASGVPALTVAELLGHSNTRTTLAVYGHVLPLAAEAAMGTMDALLRRA